MTRSASKNLRENIIKTIFFLSKWREKNVSSCQDDDIESERIMLSKKWDRQSGKDSNKAGISLILN